jgi:hypothetical protein
MKRSLSHTLVHAGLALGLTLAAPAWAETVTYPGATLLNLTGCGSNNVLAPTGSDSCKSTSLSGNAVTLNQYTVPPDTTVSDVWGAFSTTDATAMTNNQVSIDGHVTGRTYGAWLSYNGATQANVSVSGNSVTIETHADTGDGVGAEALNNGDGNAEAKVNSVTVNGGTVNYLVGGYTYVFGSGTGESWLNSVTVNDGLVSFNIEGGDAYSYANAGVSAHDNTVTVNGGEVDGELIDGIKGAYSDDNAANNHVIITGGTLKGDIYAAYIYGYSASDSVNDNDVTISGAPTLGTGLYGGHVDNLGTASGNTLNLHSADLAVDKLGEFQKLHFYLPPGLANDGSEPMMTAEADITNATVEIDLEGAGPTLQTGDKYLLLIGPAITGGNTVTPTSGTVGGFQYTLQSLRDPDRLMLVIGEPAPTTYRLDVTVIGLGSVSDNQSPKRIDTCTAAGGICSASYNDGTSVTLAATAGSGYSFVGWSGDCSGALPTASVTMNANRACTATFKNDGGRNLTPSSAPALGNGALAALALLLAVFAGAWLRGARR